MYLNLKLAFISLIIGLNLFGQDSKIELRGVILDEFNFPIPYVAIGIKAKYKGTASTEDGEFYLVLSKKELLDTLEISSIGYKPIKILVKDYVNNTLTTIVLKEDIVTLDEINVLRPSHYVNRAITSLKKNTLSSPHQLKLLYRRFSGEDDKARFFVEHFLNVLDKGPSASDFSRIEVVEGRKSADYRFVKMKQHSHSINYMASNNPMRNGVPIKQYKWNKIGDTSYDGEEVLIIEGNKSEGKHRYFKLYIGIESFSIYRMETETPWLKTLYIYQKDRNGDLYLSYHNRKMTVKEDLTSKQKTLLKTSKNKIKVSYRHEVYVIGLETDKSKINFKAYGGWGEDIGDVQIDYKPTFWQNLSIPPESKFYRQNVQELESIFGVPLETQFRAVNKN